MKNTRAVQLLFWALLSLYFLFIGYEVLSSDYLLTDEAFMLWHQPDNHLVFKIWHSLGRSFSGWMEEWLLGRSGTVTNMRYIRLLSLLQSILATLSLYYVLRRLQKGGLLLQDALIYCTVAFFAASLSSVIYIGWAVCTDVFIPIILCLFAGLFLYRSLMKGGKGRWRWRWLAVVMGIAALFFYQTIYPFVLLPFYLLFLFRRDGRLSREMYRGLAFFFGGLGVYYILFKLSMRVSGMESAVRTRLVFAPLGRLSFFFSAPLNQAFNVNAFFFARSVLSQAIMPVLLAAWVFYTFYTGRGRTVTNIRYLAGIVVWWILGYIPQLIASENFAPYRTMVVFSVMVFLLMGDLVFTIVKKGRDVTILCFAVVAILLIRGGYVYKVYVADPLAYEYSIVRGAIRDHYTAASRAVIFIRAPENGFATVFGIGPFKDEFGMPSTYKEWAPEGLVKQIVYELTGSRAAGAALKVVILSGIADLRDPLLLKDPHVFVIDMQALLRDMPASLRVPK